MSIFGHKKNGNAKESFLSGIGFGGASKEKKSWLWRRKRKNDRFFAKHKGQAVKIKNGRLGF